MFRNIRSLSWIGLTLTMGMVACHFPQSPALAQLNLSSPNSETLSQCTETQIQQWIYQLPEGNIKAFNQIVECDRKAIPELIKAINNEDKTIQIAAIAILGEFGEDAKEAIPDLISLLRTNYNSDVEKVAIYTLEKIGTPAIPELILSILRDKDENQYVRSSETEALGNCIVDLYGNWLCTFTSSVEKVSTKYKRDNPLVMCQFPVLKNILLGKCLKPSTTDTANSPQPQQTNSQQNNQPASTSQPTKK